MSARGLAIGTAIAIVLAVAAGCRAPERPASSGRQVLEPPSGLGLQPVTLPDFSRMEAPAREQMESRFAALSGRIESSRGVRPELASAYGEMGRLLMAATYLDAAEVCLDNAQTLAPDDSRWPYYLGHVYKAKGPLAKAVTSFERALQLRPNDVAALVWLGEAHLAEGRPEQADPFFAKALGLQSQTAAAHFGAGRTALARKDFPRAVTHLKQALSLDPRATATNYALGMAYRGLGDMERAAAHLAQQGTIEARPPDPLMQELDGLLQSPEAYNVRGGRELEAGNWAAAAESFRKGLEIAPDDASLRHRLGTALAQMGDVRGAVEQFERVVRTSPSFARSHYSLGVLMNDAGRFDEAVERFTAALEHDPGYVSARVQLAGVLGRSGRPADALKEYERALQSAPRLPDASFGYAMTLVRLKRYQEARDRLAEAMGQYPDQLMFSHALARLLAAAPDDRVRDGRRAKTLVDDLFKKQQSLELGETTAMMLAELGQFDQAVRVQRDILDAASKSGLLGVVRRMTVNLEQYERRRPCRVPFTDDELP